MYRVKEEESANLAWHKASIDREEKGYTGETSKARPRRIREGWFEKYIFEDRSGIDIGAQADPLNLTFRRFDFVYGDGDANDMIGVPDNTFWTVYASHVLEHLKFPHKAIRRWYDILKPGGHLIIIVPHRDLYERKRFVPSNWNPEHTYFWLPDKEDAPCTKCLKTEVLRAIPDANIVEYRVIDEGYDYSIDKNEHAIGEYSIECVIKK
jgi:SAM-dependent methyltransferase